MVVDVRTELEALIRRHGEDYASISRLIGRNPAYIQQFIKRGTPQRLSEDDRSRLAAYFRVAEEVLGGRAEPAIRTAGEGGGRSADIVMIPRVEISASAGPGGMADVEPSGRPVAFDSAVLRDIGGADLGGLSVIRVSGDSMEPVLGDGDDILVDRNDAAGRLRAGIYVLRLDGMLIVKRLLPATGKPQRFVIRSDNRRYADLEDYDPNAVDLIGRVLWAGRRIA